ncbi:uncharacterized protein J3D65DRAFT_601680 [Phyllosticta citribraziliensis]|uniref:Uncharacterized protein n=1 Tax=Phyllosticta citribraziliensis TaxID=989973 RepID=A0ABR1LZX4_9PEZI
MNGAPANAGPGGNNALNDDCRGQKRRRFDDDAAPQAPPVGCPVVRAANVVDQALAPENHNLHINITGPCDFDTAMGSYAIMSWELACGQKSAEDKEEIRQVLSRNVGFTFNAGFVTLVSFWMNFFKMRSWHRIAIWVLMEEPNLFDIPRQDCRHRLPVNPRPAYCNTNLRRLIDQLSRENYDHMVKTGNLDSPPRTALCASIEKENARRKIEWHENYRVWRSGWVFYDDEHRCQDCDFENQNRG